MSLFADHLQKALGAAYKVDRELTGGGMSRVFVATDSALGRMVVVKVLPPELAAGVNRDRFRREIQVAAQLHHPHIVPLLSAGESGDLLWYTMPFIEGQSLRAALEAKRKFSVREVIRILHDVIDALTFAHARGVIHRDIKPANILMQASHALVTDFGVAKAINAAMPITTATAAGIAIGTPAYMAPEQLAGDVTADHRMDIYAAGLLAYELLTGESPFTSPSPRETLAAQLTRDPKPLHEISPEVPLTLSAIIMRCLAKDPKDRPADADAVLRELDSLTMPMGSTPQSGGIRAPQRPRRRRILFGAGILTIAGLSALAILNQRGTKFNTSSVSADSLAVVPPVAAIPGARGGTSSNLPATQTGAPPTPKPPSAAPGAAPPVTRPKLTHADSIAIAEAIRKRLAEAKTRDSAEKVLIAREAERKMLDSIIAANSGGIGATTGPRRVIVVEPREQRTWPEATLLGRAMADSLRRMLRSQSRRYIVVDPDSVRDVLNTTRTVDSVSAALNAELIASIQLVAIRADTAQIVINLYDLGAERRQRQRATAGRPVPKSQIMANLDDLLLQTLTTLSEVSHAPRKPPAPDVTAKPPLDA